MRNARMSRQSLSTEHEIREAILPQANLVADQGVSGFLRASSDWRNQTTAEGNPMTAIASVATAAGAKRRRGRLDHRSESISSEMSERIVHCKTRSPDGEGFLQERLGVLTSRDLAATGGSPPAGNTSCSERENQRA
jgi:hypothetical protein